MTKGAFDLERVRSTGVAPAAHQAVEILRKNHLSDFWIHLDVDVLDEAIRPAVDYRLAGGMSRMSTALKVIMALGEAVGIYIAVHRTGRASSIPSADTLFFSNGFRWR